MSSKIMTLWILASILFISGCAAPQKADFTKFRDGESQVDSGRARGQQGSGS